MSLLTRCPRCSTLFRVTPTQLEARGGKVRCGRCMNVFDAFQALTVDNAALANEDSGVERESVAVAAAPAQGPGEHAVPASEDGGVERESPAITAVRAQAPGEHAAPASAASNLAATQPASQDAKPATGYSRLAAQTRLAAARLETLFARLRADDFALRRLSPVARWTIGCTIAAIVLLLQLGYAWRGELAARNAAIRSVLSSVCERTGCSVPFPRDVELVKIEASDVHMLDANQPRFVQLTATLRSYAGYYVAYPALDLVLTNANEHALARRVFVPQEYLDRDRNPKSGFPPDAEITIALDLDTGTLNAAGFRLDLLAAP